MSRLKPPLPPGSATSKGPSTAAAAAAPASDTLATSNHYQNAERALAQQLLAVLKPEALGASNKTNQNSIPGTTTNHSESKSLDVLRIFGPGPVCGVLGRGRADLRERGRNGASVGDPVRCQGQKGATAVAHPRLSDGHRSKEVARRDCGGGGVSA